VWQIARELEKRGRVHAASTVAADHTKAGVLRESSRALRESLTELAEDRGLKTLAPDARKFALLKDASKALEDKVAKQYAPMSGFSLLPGIAQWRYIWNALQKIGGQVGPTLETVAKAPVKPPVKRTALSRATRAAAPTVAGRISGLRDE
jgi:hypothetical protein